MSTHNICFYGEMEKIIQNYHQILLLNKSSVYRSNKYISVLQIYIAKYFSSPGDFDQSYILINIGYLVRFSL